MTADHTADTGINHPDPPPPSSFVSKGNKGGPGQPGSVGEQGTRGAQVSTPGEAACLVMLSQMLSYLFLNLNVVTVSFTKLNAKLNVVK